MSPLEELQAFGKKYGLVVHKRPDILGKRAGAWCINNNKVLWERDNGVLELRGYLANSTQWKALLAPDWPRFLYHHLSPRVTKEAMLRAILAHEYPELTKETPWIYRIEQCWCS